MESTTDYMQQGNVPEYKHSTVTIYVRKEIFQSGMLKKWSFKLVFFEQGRSTSDTTSNVF